MIPPYLDLDALRTITMSFPTYLDLMERQAAVPEEQIPPEEREHWTYLPLNLHRTRRILRSFAPPAELADLLSRIDGPRFWLVLTEPWCGDSAQCLPYIVRLAETSPRVELGLVLRDEHPEVMDRFLTAGKRSIPVLAALAPDGRVVWRWGPRPAAAQAVFDAARDEGLPREKILERLHLWYGRDRGRHLLAELRDVIVRHEELAGTGD